MVLEIKTTTRSKAALERDIDAEAKRNLGGGSQNLRKSRADEVSHASNVGQHRDAPLQERRIHHALPHQHPHEVEVFLPAGDELQDR